jgi:hypothetical protein
MFTAAERTDETLHIDADSYFISTAAEITVDVPQTAPYSLRSALLMNRA